MGKPVSNLRLFVGVYPPEEHARGMVEALGACGGELPAHRVAAVEQVHLTVQFVGDVPVRRLDDVLESVERAASGIAGFALAPEKLISLPERGAARLVALQTDAPAQLLELQRRLARRLARSPRSGGTKAGDRFLPHFTLCRFRSPRRGVRIGQPVSLPAFDVGAIRVMKSKLTPEGSIHEEVAAVALE